MWIKDSTAVQQKKPILNRKLLTNYVLKLLCGREYSVNKQKLTAYKIEEDIVIQYGNCTYKPLSGPNDGDNIFGKIIFAFRKVNKSNKAGHISYDPQEIIAIHNDLRTIEVTETDTFLCICEKIDDVLKKHNSRFVIFYVKRNNIQNSGTASTASAIFNDIIQNSKKYKNYEVIYKGQIQ